MRELKRKKLEKQFAKIDQLYGFLKADGFTAAQKRWFEAEALEVSAELVQLKDFLNGEWSSNSMTDQDKAKLREEIIQDVAPIITSEGAEVYFALVRLVEKINAMHFHPPWAVADKPEKKRWLHVPSGVEYEYRGPEGPIMHIGGKKLIVYHKIGLESAGFYGLIIKTLEDTSFQKLKRCKECQRFFIADRLSDKFCRPECSKAYFDRGAIDRVRKSRANPQVEEKRQVGKKQPKKRRRPAKVKGKRRTRS
jgi:hypothetical protein